MKPRRYQWVVIFWMLFLFHASATVRYVNVNNSSSASPYTNWVTAAQTIQDAIDASSDGDQILVTNGVYQTGGRVVYGYLTNRVVINKAVTAQSVNGPEVTTILGFPTNGDGAVRCVYLTNNATLLGFTLAFGDTRKTGDANLEQSGGGVWCESSNVFLFNCVIASNNASQYGGGACSGTLSNCTFVGNTAAYGGGAAKGYHQDVSGGGAYGSTLSNCTISNNSISVNVGAYADGITIYGGGVESCTLNNCLLVSNSLSALGYSSYGFGAYGGGADSSTLSNCTVVGNIATNDYSRTYGGGAENSSLNHCTLSGNSAVYGGGADNSTLNYCTLMGNSAVMSGGANGMLTNCLLYGNTAYTGGGGAAYGVLVNCTVVSNSQTQHGYGGGGGVLGSVAKNCIIYYNNSSNGSSNYYYLAFPSTPFLTNCCTFPLPSSGVGNITNAPNFIDLAGGNFHLQTNSPCINAGTNSFTATGTDLDGNPRIVGIAVDMGAYEYQGPTSILPYVWLLQFGLPTDGSADYADSDGDGMNNWQEWRTGTNPTDALSVLKILSLNKFGLFNMIVTWQSVSNATYYLQRSSNLGAHPAFVMIHSNIPGQAGTTSNTDSSAVGPGPYFYRVGVQ
jgi:hypothetical protein